MLMDSYRAFKRAGELFDKSHLEWMIDAKKTKMIFQKAMPYFTAGKLVWVLGDKLKPPIFSEVRSYFPQNNDWYRGPTELVQNFFYFFI
jgi:hypothetical protein